MAKAKSTSAKEAKVITREHLDTLAEVQEAIDNATDDIRDLGNDGDQSQITIGFTLGALYQSLVEAYEKLDKLYEELDPESDVEEFEF